MKTYSAYRFITKDPIIDSVRTVVQDTYGAKITNKGLKAIEVDGGPTVSCLNGWFRGDTKRPQNCTVEAALRAMGYERRVVKKHKNGKG